MKRSLPLALGLLALVLALWHFTKPRPTPPAPAPEVTRPVAAVPTPTPVQTKANVEARSNPPTQDEKTERNAARPEAGTGENQLEHLFRSVIEANAAELKLTPAQVDRLASDYLEFQEIYAVQAARFLQETTFDPSSVTVKIPAYPVEGKLLRDMFFQRLETDFPEGKAEEIRKQLSGFLDNAFRGFGVSEQSFTITRSPEVPDAFEVQWDSKIPEGQGAQASAQTSFAGSAGTALLYREQVASGEYRFLGDVVERRFPRAGR